jgi:YVTN family beta-propeller protein
MNFQSAKRLNISGALLGVVCLAAAPAASAADKAMAYVSNQNGDVTVIDLATHEIVQEINVGAEGPRGIGVTADGKLLVTANADSGNLTVMDRKTGKIIRHIKIGKNPEFVRIRGDQAFVSFEPASIGGPPPKPGSKEAEELAQQREEDDEEPAKIAIVDLKKGKVISEITGGMETEGIEFSADGKKILITNEADENVTVHDIATGKLLKTISTKEYGNRPRGIKRSPDGSYYVASIEYGDKLVVLDGEFNVKKVVPTGAVPYGVAFDRSGKHLYVALARGKVLQVFDTATWQTVKNIPTGDRCWHFTFTPDDKQILVACGRSNEVVVIDVKTMEPIKRIDDKKLPWGIVTYPKSVGSLDMP